MGRLFEQFFPQPAALKTGQKWHVFISYRSLDRPWVLKLHDALRHLKYEVFVDQFVLNAAAPLASSLDEGIQKSASGIVVWSKNYDSSDWTTGEYNALIARLNQSQGFGFGIATLDSTPLRALLAGRIYTDFANQQDGPCGLPLLRLMLGMLDKPLPDEAVKVATQIDGERKDFLTRIKAARRNATPEVIVELVAAEGEAWLDSPVLGCAAVEGLIAARQFDAAATVLNRLGQLFPEAVRPRQLQAFAARRQGDWLTALNILGAMYEEGFRDTETIGMYAAAWWIRYEKSKNRLYLLKSRDLYREGFEFSSTDYYTGINAASKSLFLGERETSRQLAARVEELFQEKPTDYYGLATLGEARLLQEDYSQACQYYQRAILSALGDTGSHEGTLAQAQEIMRFLGTPDSERVQIEQVFSHLKGAAQAAGAAPTN